MVILHRAVLQQLEDLPFKYYKVLPDFCCNAEFSKTQFRLEKITDQTRNHHLALPFQALFILPYELLENPSTRQDNMKAQFLNMIQNIKRAKTLCVPPAKDSEEDVLLNLAKYVLIPLFNEVVFEEKNQLKISSLGAKAGHIGIGNFSTLHGTPDMVIEACSVIWTAESPTYEEEEGFQGERHRSTYMGDLHRIDSCHSPVSARLPFKLRQVNTSLQW